MPRHPSPSPTRASAGPEIRPCTPVREAGRTRNRGRVWRDRARLGSHTRPRSGGAGDWDAGGWIGPGSAATGVPEVPHTARPGCRGRWVHGHGCCRERPIRVNRYRTTVESGVASRACAPMRSPKGMGRCSSARRAAVSTRRAWKRPCAPMRTRGSRRIVSSASSSGRSTDPRLDEREPTAPRAVSSAPVRRSVRRTHLKERVRHPARFLKWSPRRRTDRSVWCQRSSGARSPWPSSPSSA